MDWAGAVRALPRDRLARKGAWLQGPCGAG